MGISITKCTLSYLNNGFIISKLEHQNDSIEQRTSKVERNRLHGVARAVARRLLQCIEEVSRRIQLEVVLRD